MKRITFGIALTAAAVAANAQNNPAAAQADAVRQQRQAEDMQRDLKAGDAVPTLYSEEDADMGPQSVLRKRKHSWFRVSADEQVYYTDNMFFESRTRTWIAGRSEPLEAGISVATVEAALTTPSCITRWASYRAEVGYRHQFFNYFGNDEPVARFSPLRVDDFDFDASTAFAGVIAQTAHYQFRAGLDYTRLLRDNAVTDDYEEFYREYVPRWSVQRNFRVCDRSQLSVAYLGSYHFTDEEPVFVYFPAVGLRHGFEDRNERWEHAGVVAYSYSLPANFVVQPYYRIQFTEYTSLPGGASASDLLHTAGIGLGWYPCENFSARVFANYNWNDPDGGADGYEQWNAGGGVAATVRF